MCGHNVTLGDVFITMSLHFYSYMYTSCYMYMYTERKSIHVYIYVPTIIHTCLHKQGPGNTPTMLLHVNRSLCKCNWVYTHILVLYRTRTVHVSV